MPSFHSALKATTVLCFLRGKSARNGSRRSCVVLANAATGQKCFNPRVNALMTGEVANNFELLHQQLYCTKIFVSLLCPLFCFLFFIFNKLFSFVAFRTCLFFIIFGLFYSVPKIVVRPQCASGMSVASTRLQARSWMLATALNHDRWLSIVVGPQIVRDGTKALGDWLVLVDSYILASKSVFNHLRQRCTKA